MFSDIISPCDASVCATTAEILNGIIVTPGEIEAALRILSLLPQGAQCEPAAQAAALQAYVQDAGGGDAVLRAAALHARLTALGKWTAACDPQHQSETNAVFEAAARFPLHDCDTGVGFDAAGFQEMVLFIEELPW